MAVHQLLLLAFLHLGLLATPSSCSTSAFPDFSIFTAGQEQSAVADCTKNSLVCTEKPMCSADNKAIYDDLKTCAHSVRNNVEKCQVEKLKELNTLLYEGYNDVKVVYCENSTIKAELTTFIDNNCWESILVCLAPLEMLESKSTQYEDDFCKDLKKFIDDDCLDDSLKECSELFANFRNTYFNHIPCKSDLTTALAGGRLWPSLLLTLLLPTLLL